jgi:hypothetical protein
MTTSTYRSNSRYFSLLLAHAYPNWPDTGTYAAHTTFMRELYGQQRVNLQYSIMQNNYFNSSINKLCSIKYKAFEMGENVFRILTKNAA